MIIATETILCPGCLQGTNAAIEQNMGEWPMYVHLCECGYLIMESEWDVLETAAQQAACSRPADTAASEGGSPTAQNSIDTTNAQPPAG